MSETENDAQRKQDPTKTATPDAGVKYEVSGATSVAAIPSTSEQVENYQVLDMSKTGDVVQRQQRPTKTASPDTGAKYEVSVATLVAATLSNNERIENYRVFTNLKEAYPFDDVVAKVYFKGENTPYAFAMQLKHIGKGEKFDVDKYLNGYGKIFDVGGFETIGNISVANIHFSYFCINNVKTADYTLHACNPIGESWRSTLSFPNCHKLLHSKLINGTYKDFLDNFHLYFHQPNNYKIKENIRNLCKLKDVNEVNGILNYVDRFFEKGELWKRGLLKDVFETELLKIHLSDYISPLADTIQLQNSQTLTWNKLTLQDNVTIVKAEADIEKVLYGCIAQAVNLLLNKNVDWKTCKVNTLDSDIISEFKNLFISEEDRVGHWIDPPTTLKSLIIELWKSREIPLILRSDDELLVLKDYGHLNKSYIIITNNVENRRDECNRYKLKVFTHISDIESLEMRDELLKKIPISLQGRKPITLHEIVNRHSDLTETLSCSHVLHLMKPRKAYLSKECLDGSHDRIFLIEDPNSTMKYNIASINEGGNIAIRCRSEEIAKYREKIKENPKFQNYEIYQCATSSENENLILVKGNESLLREFFVDEDGEGVYAQGNNLVPIVGPSLKSIQHSYIPRFLRSAVVSKSLFDSETKGICFFSGDVGNLEENIRKYLVEAPEEMKFCNRNIFIKARYKDVGKYWRKASVLKCPLLHLHIEGTDMELCKYRNWKGLSDNISYSERIIPEENILTEVTDGITVVTGEPGIGKSSLLQSLLKNHCMEKYVLFYNLVDYERFLTKEKLVPTNTSLDFLLERSKSKRYEEFLSALFKIRDRVIVLLDSFDEVLHTHKESVLHFIGNLAASKVQIIIASRIIANHILMANFEIRILKVDSLRPNDCKEYIKNCELSQKVLATIPYEFCQNPLYLNLFKVICEHNVNLKHFNKLSLFQNVIEIKVEQYFQRYFSSEHLPKKEHHLAPVWELHFQLALIRMLGVDIVNKLFQLENKNVLTNELKLGIVLSVDETGYPLFVHETFAEYLVAKWIIRNKTKDSAKNIYLELLKQNKLYVLDILCEHLKLHKAVLEKNKKQIERYAGVRSYLEETDDLGRMAIHVAAAHQSNAFWFTINTITRNMHKFKISFTHTDVLMQWNWVEHAYQSNVVHLRLFHTVPMFDMISTPVWEAYLNCIAQKMRVDREMPTNIFKNFDSSAIYVEAMNRGSIDMIRRLVFIEDVHFNGKYSTNIMKLTALHFGCICGNVKAVKKLIKRKHINARDSFGSTPLHYSVMRSETSIDVTKILLENGSKIDIVNDFGNTPIHTSVSTGNLDVARLLLQKGAHMSSVRNYMDQFLSSAFHREDENMIELLLESQTGRDYLTVGLLYASRQGNWEIVQSLLEKGAIVNVGNKTPLMFAAERGNSDIVKLLLQRGANVNCTTREGTTPLMFASGKGNLDVAKMLLQRSAIVDSTTRDGRTPLMFASEKGNLAVVKLLLKEGAHVSSTTMEGKTPLMFASENGNLNIVKLLLELGANVISSTVDGRTALMFASARGNFDVARMLLERGSNINSIDSDGRTPLMFASEKGNIDVVKLLLEEGANVISATVDGRTPIMFASTSDSSDVVKMLLERGADVNGTTINGKTPLMFASERATTDVVQLLLRKGSYVNSTTTEGMTPLMFASIRGNLDIAEMLLEKGANINSTLPDGRTPLMFAAAWGSSDVVKMLLKKGANANSTTTDGETPLMFGSRSRKLDILEILLDYGANVNSTTTHGKTSIMIAAECVHMDVVRLLRKRGAYIDGITNKLILMFIDF